MVVEGHPLLSGLEVKMHGFGTGGLGPPALLLGGVLVVALVALTLHLLFPVTKKRPKGGVVLSKMARLCPVCQTKLTKAERNGFEIDVCPGCQGVWLSKGKLEQITG
jgi:hypothetical protein